MDQKAAIRFSEQKYYRRQEIAEEISPPLLEKVWQVTCDYRRLFCFNYPLKTAGGYDFNIHITPGLLDKINQVERSFYKILGRFLWLSAQESISNDKVLKNFVKKKQKAEILEFAKFSGLSLTNEQLEKIIFSTEPRLTTLLIPLYGYYENLKTLMWEPKEIFDFELIKSVWRRFDAGHQESDIYRQREHDDLLSGDKSIAVPPEKIKEYLDLAIEFVNSNYHISDFLTACIFLSYFIYVMPFEHHSLEAGCILTLSLLSKEYGAAAFLIPLLSLIQNNEQEFQALLIESGKTGDLTYLVSFFLTLLEPELKKLSKEINELKNPMPAVYQIIEKYVDNVDLDEPKDKNKDNDREKEKEKEKEREIVSEVKKGIERDNTSPYFPPVFLESSEFAQDLVEHLPELKYYQAYFYATHRDCKKYYTISQFQKISNVSYETARTGMEFLVNLGYYNKEMRKNKFVYKVREY